MGCADILEALVHQADQLAGSVHLLGDFSGDESLEQVSQCLVLLGGEQAGLLGELGSHVGARSSQRHSPEWPGDGDADRQGVVRLVVLSIPPGAELLAPLPHGLAHTVGADRVAVGLTDERGYGVSEGARSAGAVVNRRHRRVPSVVVLFGHGGSVEQPWHAEGAARRLDHCHALRARFIQFCCGVPGVALVLVVVTTAASFASRAAANSFCALSRSARLTTSDASTSW